MDMTYPGKNEAMAENAAIEDCPLDVAGESEGGFPCGEFLWDVEKEDVSAQTL